MNLYDAMKDVLNLAQKADNIELYRQLLDLSAQALEQQSEITRLKEENVELRKAKDIEERIIRHEQPFITLANENANLMYCSTCWGKSKALIQLQCFDSGKFICPECETRGYYSKSNQDYNFFN